MHFAMDAVHEMLTVFFLVKYIPTWMPGMQWKKQALHVKQIVWEARHRPYRMAHDAVVGTLPIPDHRVR